LTGAELAKAAADAGVTTTTNLSTAALLKNIAAYAIANPLVLAAAAGIALLTAGIVAYVKSQNKEEDALEASTKKLEESTEKAEETQ
jgi:hypothetical protein